MTKQVKGLLIGMGIGTVITVPAMTVGILHQKYPVKHMKAKQEPKGISELDRLKLKNGMLKDMVKGAIEENKKLKKDLLWERNKPATSIYIGGKHD